MFADINNLVVSPGLVNYVYMNYVCGCLFFQFKDGCEFHQINSLQTLMRLQYTANLELGSPIVKTEMVFSLSSGTRQLWFGVVLKFRILINGKVMKFCFKSGNRCIINYDIYT